MSNSTMSVLYPEFWAASFDSLDLGLYNLQNVVKSDFSDEIKTRGDQVNIPVAESFTAGTYVPGTVTPATISQESSAITLNQSKSIAITLTDDEISKGGGYKLIEEYGVGMANAILTIFNDEIYKTALGGTNFIDAISGVDEDDIVDARKNLSANKIPADNRVLVISPDDYGDLLKLDAFQHTNIIGDQRAIKDGVVDRRFGFDVLENNSIATYTPFDLAGAVNNKGAAYAAGATSIVVDTFNDDANPIRKGDIFSIAGGSIAATLYTVTSTEVTASDTTTLNFSPALVGTTPADDEAVVTFQATRSLIAMRKNAIGVVARTFAPVPGTMSKVINYQGIPIRISVWSQDLVVKVQYDILFGSTILSQGRIERIITA